jgi:hypothetical protein|mmetsp:Transcript_1835/g.6938  ORF Transcript_1835/g.6938 Transcript_1835/m.6938 type:complete len:325 (-) Transcript_1835:1988-2962(-)
MTSSRFFAHASTSDTDAAARVSPTARLAASERVRALLREVRERRHGDGRLEKDTVGRNNSWLKSEDVVPDTTGDDPGEDGDFCAICLDTPRVPAVLCGTQGDALGCSSAANHVFCLDCVERWSSVTNACPLCKSKFSEIRWADQTSGAQRSRAVTPKETPDSDDETAQVLARELERLENTSCEACGSGDDESNILLCDGCDAGAHTRCCWPPLRAVPLDEWFCPSCDGEDEILRWPERTRGAPTPTVSQAPRRLLPRVQWRRRREWYQAWQAFHAATRDKEESSAKRKQEAETPPKKPPKTFELFDVKKTFEEFKFGGSSSLGI